MDKPIWTILLAVLTLVLGILVSVVGFIAVGALGKVDSATTKITQIETNMGDVDFGVLQTQITQVLADTARDDAQDAAIAEVGRKLAMYRGELTETDRKFWKIHSATQRAINEARVAYNARHPDEAAFPLFDFSSSIRDD